MGSSTDGAQGLPACGWTWMGRGRGGEVPCRASLAAGEHSLAPTSESEEWWSAGADPRSPAAAAAAAAVAAAAKYLPGAQGGLRALLLIV